jgi:hypothetical protein
MQNPKILPRLSALELRSTYEANRTPEARVLLWEIDRLRKLVLDYHYLAGLAAKNSPAAGSIAETVLKYLALEPCVVEKDQAERADPKPYSKYYDPHKSPGPSSRNTRYPPRT